MESWTLSKDGWKDDVYNRLEFDGVDDYVEFPSLDTSNLPYFHMSIDMEKHDAADSVSFEQFVDGDSYVQLLWHTNGRVYGVIRDNTTSYGYVHIGDTGRHIITMVYQGYLTGNENRLQVSVDGVDQTLTFVGTLPSVTPDLSSVNPTLGVQAGGYVKGIVHSMHTRGISGELLSKWDNVIGNVFIDSIGGDKNGIIYGATVDRIDYSIDKSGNDNVIVPVKSYCAEFGSGDTIDFTDLTGVTVVSHDGTATLTVSGNSVVCTSGVGTAWNLLLSDGTFLPLQGSCYDISGNGNHGTNNGCDLTVVQDEFHYNLRKGFGQGGNAITDKDFLNWSDPTVPDGWVKFGTHDATNFVEESPDGCRLVSDGTSVSIYYSTSFTKGKIYEISLDATNVSGSAKVRFSGVSCMITSDGHHTIAGCNTGGTLYFQRNSSCDVTIKNLVVREVAIPRLADNSGFPVTVAEEHLAGTWNNMPESYFRFPTTLTLDIMDKSDVGIWSATIRASVHYDSSNKNDWHSSELVQAYLDDNINPTYKNRIFVADNNTTFIKDGSSFITDSGAYVVELGDGSTQSKQVLVYNTEQTGEALEKIIKYLSKEY